MQRQPALKEADVKSKPLTLQSRPCSGGSRQAVSKLEWKPAAEQTKRAGCAAIQLHRQDFEAAHLRLLAGKNYFAAN